MANDNDHSIYGGAIQSIESSIRQSCPTCGRGATNLSTPTVDDLEAISTIRDGFNKYRRDFSPEMADRFRRFENTIGYLHALIEGTKDGS